MDLDTLTVLGSSGAGILTLSSIKAWAFIKTHAIITRVELNQLRHDVQSKESQITELQRQLDAIRAPRDTRGRAVPTGQFELGLQTDAPKTQKFGPVQVAIDDERHEIYEVWYTGERYKYFTENLVLVRRNGNYKWVTSDKVESRDEKVQPWWYVDEKGRQVFYREFKRRDGSKKLVYSYQDPSHPVKKIKKEVKHA